LTALTSPRRRSSEEVDDRREVELPRRGQQLGRVAHPRGFGAVALNSPVEQVSATGWSCRSSSSSGTGDALELRVLALHEPDHSMRPTCSSARSACTRGLP